MTHIEHATKIGKSGRIVLPAPVRKELGLREGDDVVLVVEDGGVHLLTPAQAVRRAQELVRRFVAEGRRLSDELISERRAEESHE